MRCLPSFTYYFLYALFDQPTHCYVQIQFDLPSVANLNEELIRDTTGWDILFANYEIHLRDFNMKSQTSRQLVSEANEAFVRKLFVGFPIHTNP